MIGDTNMDGKLVELREQHRGLERQIEDISRTTPSNLSEVQRLKKEKLALKDRIAELERTLPNIIA